MGMAVTAALCANPLDASGTSYALTSALAAAGNTPDQPAPTLYYDEISSVFGRSGLAASRNPIADILRKGYKSSATSQWSVNRVNEKFSIFTPFLMTGLRVAVPRDIRSRCIPIVMEPGTPRKYFDARTAEPEAQALAACLSQATGKRLADIAAFRARGIHPKLKDRKLEVWEGLFAVAYVLGGQEWLNRCLAAFKELSLAESDQVVLTPRQQTIKDIAGVTEDCDRKYVLADGTAFMGGLVLIDELKRVDNPRYQGRSEASIGQLVSDALPMNSVQVTTVEGKRVRGYYADDITAAWEKIRPDDPDDAEIPEEANPFEVEDVNASARSPSRPQRTFPQDCTKPRTRCTKRTGFSRCNSPSLVPSRGTSPVVSAAMSLTRWPVPTTHTCNTCITLGREDDHTRPLRPDTRAVPRRMGHRQSPPPVRGVRRLPAMERCPNQQRREGRRPMGNNAPWGGPGTDGMAGAFILLGSIGGLIVFGLLLALICMATQKR